MTLLDLRGVKSYRQILSRRFESAFQTGSLPRRHPQKQNEEYPYVWCSFFMVSFLVTRYVRRLSSLYVLLFRNRNMKSFMIRIDSKPRYNFQNKKPGWRDFVLNLRVTRRHYTCIIIARAFVVSGRFGEIVFAHQKFFLSYAYGADRIPLVRPCFRELITFNLLAFDDDDNLKLTAWVAYMQCQD